MAADRARVAREIYRSSHMASHRRDAAQTSWRWSLVVPRLASSFVESFTVQLFTADHWRDTCRPARYPHRSARIWIPSSPHAYIICQGSLTWSAKATAGAESDDDDGDDDTGGSGGGDDDDDDGDDNDSGAVVGGMEFMGLDFHIQGDVTAEEAVELREALRQSLEHAREQCALALPAAVSHREPLDVSRDSVYG